MGTMENPKEDLPYNDDVIVKTLEMPESCPDMAVDGDQLGVHYTVSASNEHNTQGYLYSNGKKFDSSLDRHRIFPVTLGEGRVIKGWEKGLWGMCVECGEEKTHHSCRYGLRKHGCWRPYPPRRHSGF
ncbi:hypothetical protein BLSTO_00756 [Blastocystis sp. subtype 1]